MLVANESKAALERLTLIRFFEELRGLGYAGGYDAVRHYARRWGQERGQSRWRLGPVLRIQGRIDTLDRWICDRQGTGDIKISPQGERRVERKSRSYRSPRLIQLSEPRECSRKMKCATG